MRQRVIIDHPKEFAGETGWIVTQDEYTIRNPNMVQVRFDRICCSAMFHKSEVRLLPGDELDRAA